MVSPETKSLPRNPKEGVEEDHLLFLRGALHDEVAEIIGLNPQTVKTDQQKSILFAKKLLEDGTIGEDLTYWNELQKLYSTNNRALPKDFVARLRLEAFLIARRGVARDDYDLLDKFFAIGKSIDHVWFSKSNNTYKDDQSFIRDEFNEGKDSRNGNNHAVADIAEQLENEQVKVYGEELRRSGPF